MPTSSFRHRTVFSRRTIFGDEPDPFFSLVQSVRANGTELVDLTISNPSQVGFRQRLALPPIVAREVGCDYVPEPLGLASARDAVARYYAVRGASCQPDQVWLTAGTSEAYAQVFALLGDPGDVVLVPSPGYPLFDFIAPVMGMDTHAYLLDYDTNWFTSVAGIESAWKQCEAQGRTVAAVVAVAPSNPLGGYLQRDGLPGLQTWCAQRSIALVVDEVFADYPVAPSASAVRTVVGESPCFTIVLSGLSKVAASPQVKLAWGVVGGPAPWQRQALARLEYISDTFLNVTTAVQRALPSIVDALVPVQREIVERLRDHWNNLQQLAATNGISVLPCEGGWSAVVRLPQAHACLDQVGDHEEPSVAWARHLLLDHRVLVQPGASFGLAGAHVVLSLISPPSTWREGLRRLVAAAS